jgi:hypothetical protein
MAKWFDRVWEFFEDEPIYAPSHEGVVDGWKVAYEAQKERADLAERKLALLKGMSDDMIKYGWGMQYGHDIRTILLMTEEELNEDYGD